jgi:hypothetical protein
MALASTLARGDAPVAGAARRLYRSWWWSVPLALALTAAVVLVVQAARYQPLVWGGGVGDGYPGVAGTGNAQRINDAHNQEGQYFVASTVGSFVVSFTITNTGAHAVTIDGARLLPFSFQTLPYSGALSFGALMNVPDAQGAATPVRHGLGVAAGQTVYLALRVTLVSHCTYPDATLGFNTIYLRSHYLGFSHDVTVTLPTTFLMAEPTPRQPGAVCPATT